jgi:membrane protein DedA with SNARE-associated domain
MFYVFLSPLALQQHFLLTMCLVETLGTKCKVFIYIYPLYFIITYIGFIDTSIDHLQSFILVPCYVTILVMYFLIATRTRGR